MFKSSSKVALSTVIGLIMGLTCVISAMAGGGDIKAFFNLPSVFITIGGTLSALVISFPPERLRNLGTVMRKAFSREKNDIPEDIRTIVALAEISRREGLLALDDVVDKYTDDVFLKRGISLIIDGADGDQLRTSLEGETYYMQQRHQKGYAMLDYIATTAPALGLMGTYIGLIPMLNHLDDPTKLGPLLALELVTSFYGCFIAYVIFAPLAKRLKFMNMEEVSRREILIEGLTYIQQGINPKVISEELFSYMNMDRNAKTETQKETQQQHAPLKAKEVL